MISVGRYKCRQGRLIQAHKNALSEIWPEYGVDGDIPLSLAGHFGREAPCHLEIGFGVGDALLERATKHPENNHLGVEVYPPGIAQLLLGLKERGISNVRIDRRDVMDVFIGLPTASLCEVALFFPDPWPKKRHHKRRLVQKPFIDQVLRVLESGGHFQVATDWEDYAQQILTLIEATPGFRNLAESGGFYPGPVERPLTKFEKRGLKRGHQVRDLLYRRL